MAFSNSMFSTKISDQTQCLLDLVLVSTKMTFSNSIQLKMIKISTVFGTLEVIKSDFF